MYKCYYISLDSNIDNNSIIKQKYLLDSCSKYNIKPIRFNAINKLEGLNFIDNFLKRNNIGRKKFHKKLKKPDRYIEGRIGILSSHLKLWEMCINDNINYLVLEDDSYMIDNLNYKIINDKIKNNKTDLFLLDLFNPYNNDYEELIKKHKNLDNEFNEGHVKKNKYGSKGAYCYIITPLGCKKIIKYIKKSDELLAADYYFNEKILNIMTSNKTIFRINPNFPAGKISTTHS